MNRFDWLFIALNAFMGFWAFLGFASNDDDTLMVSALLTMLVAVINATVLYQGRTRKQTTEKQRPALEDEMDARTVLDLDARLDALERAQSDALDAARWRSLVESGQVTGPAADREGDAADSTMGTARRNGQ